MIGLANDPFTYVATFMCEHHSPHTSYYRKDSSIHWMNLDSRALFSNSISSLRVTYDTILWSVR